MIRALLILVVSITIFASCRSTKKIQTAIGKIDSTSTVAIPPAANPAEDTIAFIKENYMQVVKNRFDFTTFSAKIDLDYTDAEGK